MNRTVYRSALVLAAGAALCLGGPASAQYPPATPALGAATCANLDDTSPASGQSVTASGVPGCFAPGENVRGQIESDPVVVFRVPTSADGGYRATFATPTIAPGTHTFRVVGEASGRSYSRPITIVGGGAVGSGVGLPRTGADLLALVLWALLALGGGSFLVGLTWRRYRLAHREARERAEEVPVPHLEPAAADA